jgi:hypothetical protein
LKHGLHVYYCSEACQQRDWKVHKKTCGPKYDGTLDALDQMTLDDAEGPSSQLGSFGDFESTVLISISSGADVNAVLPGRQHHFAATRFSKGLRGVGACVDRGGGGRQQGDDLRADDAYALGCPQWPRGGYTGAHRGRRRFQLRRWVRRGDSAFRRRAEGCEAAARALIAAGAEIDKATRCVRTPLFVAGHYGHTEIDAVADRGGRGHQPLG